MSETTQLQIPSEARNDKKSFELLRVWVANSEQHISLRAGVWDDPAAWGIMLADLAGHIANTFEQSGTLPRDKALVAIHEGFEAEMASPSDELSGDFTN